MKTVNLLEVPIYNNRLTLDKAYKTSKQRQQQAVQSTALGLMIAQERKLLKKN